MDGGSHHHCYLDGCTKTAVWRPILVVSSDGKDDHARVIYYDDWVCMEHRETLTVEEFVAGRWDALLLSFAELHHQLPAPEYASIRWLPAAVGFPR